VQQISIYCTAASAAAREFVIQGPAVDWEPTFNHMLCS
jgi:hypothetical protein